MATPGKHSIEELCEFLDTRADCCVKTLVVNGSEADVVALVLRGDHELNVLKAERLDGVSSPLRLAQREQISEVLGSDIGSIGPIGLAIPTYVDHGAAQLSDFVCGANQNDRHLVNANWGRDCEDPAGLLLRGQLIKGAVVAPTNHFFAFEFGQDLILAAQHAGCALTQIKDFTRFLHFDLNVIQLGANSGGDVAG